MDGNIRIRTIFVQSNIWHDDEKNEKQKCEFLNEFVSFGHGRRMFFNQNSSRKTAMMAN